MKATLKGITAVLFILFSIGFLYAQEESFSYRPFVEEGKVWNRIQDCKHYIEGDTLINGHPCKKWIQQYDKVGTQDKYTCYIYEENKRVWFIAEGDTISRLYFDFGSNVGDTLMVSSPNAAICYLDIKGGWDIRVDTIVITDITHEYWGGRMQKAFWHKTTRPFREGFYEHPVKVRMCILEGIGSWINPVSIGSTLYGEVWQWLNNCYVGEELLYDNTLNPEYMRAMDIKENHFPKLSHDLFDLSGRRLSAPPARGVYIEDGKKIIK